MTSPTHLFIMKSSQSSEKLPLPPNKITPIARHAIPAVSNAKGLDLLLKKGIKVKTLILNKKEISEDRLSTPMSLSKNLPKLKKITKRSGSLHCIEVDLANSQDIRSLLKIQNEMRYLQSLKINRGVLANAAAKKNFQRFLLRAKWTKTYSTTPETAIPPKDAMQTKERAYVALEMKKSENDRSFNKPQRLIVALKKDLPWLVSIRDNKDSLDFAINCYYEKEKKEYEKRISIFIRRLNSGNRFKEITIPVRLKDEAYKLLPLLQVMNVKVRARLDLGSLLKQDNKKIIENFLSRKDARLVIWPSSFSWKNLFDFLSFGQEMFFEHKSYLCLTNFTFYFHSSSEEVKPALINYFTNVNIEWQQLSFEFDTNSTDWFNEDKKLWLTKMLDEMCKEENKGKYSQINFEIELNDNFEAYLYSEIVEKIKLVIQSFAQLLQEKKIVLTLNYQVADEGNLLLFLKSLRNISSKPLDLLRFRGYHPKIGQLINKVEKLQALEEPEDLKERLYFVKTQIKKTENCINEARKLYDDLDKLREDGCFLSFQIAEEDRIQRLQAWFEKFKQSVQM